MVRIDGGTFRMGSDEFYPDERPVHERTVGTFWIDRYAVTNADFARFVTDTGYVTVAERPMDPADYPGVAPEDLEEAHRPAVKEVREPTPVHPRPELRGVGEHPAASATTVLAFCAAMVPSNAFRPAASSDQ